MPGPERRVEGRVVLGREDTRRLEGAVDRHFSGIRGANKAMLSSALVSAAYVHPDIAAWVRDKPAALSTVHAVNVYAKLGARAARSLKAASDKGASHAALLAAAHRVLTDNVHTGVEDAHNAVRLMAEHPAPQRIAELLSTAHGPTIVRSTSYLPQRLANRVLEVYAENPEHRAKISEILGLHKLTAARLLADSTHESDGSDEGKPEARKLIDVIYTFQDHAVEALDNEITHKADLVNAAARFISRDPGETNHAAGALLFTLAGRDRYGVEEWAKTIAAAADPVAALEKWRAAASGSRK